MKEAVDFLYLENYDASCSRETVIAGTKTREKLFSWYIRRSLLCSIENNVFSLSLTTARHFKVLYYPWLILVASPPKLI